MKNKTLYRTIIDQSKFIESHRLNSGPGAPYEINKNVRRGLEQAKQEELNRTKKYFIERFAENHQGISKVVDGNATFHSYGEPIIDHVRHLEDVYREVGSGIISKNTLLGMSRSSRMFSTSENAREAVQYLREQRIIDPGKFFSSRVIHPANGIISKMNSSNKTVGLSVLAGLTIGAPIGAYLGYQPDRAEFAFLGGMAGLIPPMVAVATISCLGEGLARISKQRQNFEDALKNLDEDARKYFSLEAEK
jgi:hypothetical protein